VLKGDLIFADEEGVPQGHPQALMLVPLGYFLGCVGIPKLELVIEVIGNNKERKRNHSTETQDFNVENPLQQREVKTTGASQ
jgi:hypothetical protein